MVLLHVHHLQLEDLTISALGFFFHRSILTQKRLGAD